MNEIYTVTVNYPASLAITFNVESPYNEDGVLEQVFGWFNHGSGMERDDFQKHGCRSLSVHDFVRVNGQWYQVRGVGWHKVTDEYVDLIEEAVVNHPSFEKEGEWYALGEVMREKGVGLI